MGPQSKKRKLAPASSPDAKRSKNSTTKTAKISTGAKPAVKKNQKRRKPAPQRKVTDVSSLDWQTVGEEFGGLEVIEGVDVVKAGNTVQFLVPTKKGDKSAKAETEDQDVDDGPFEGFGDDAEEQGGAAGQADDEEAGRQSEELGVKGTGKSKKDMEQPEPRKDKPTKQKQKQGKQTASKDKPQEPTSSVGNAFDALADMADKEENNSIDMADWVALDLSPPILSAIAKLGFPKPTVIQRKSIPQIVAGDDVIGKAQTGSGKTLAFAIPIVEKWLEINEGEAEEQEENGGDDEDGEKATTGKVPMAVVLSPTRELAKQIGDHIKALCDGLPKAPYICVVTGGLSIHKQQRQLERADIVIGTPGRLWEVLGGDMALQHKFTQIKFLVVDEADRLFKTGQFKEAEDIIGALDRRDPEDNAHGRKDLDVEDLPPRQTLVFSATFDKALQAKLAGKGKSKPRGEEEDQMAYLMKSLQFRSEPQFIDANPVSRMAEGLREGLIECGAMEKDLYLYTVLMLNPARRTLIFTNSISAVRRLTPLLQNLNIGALPLHSQMAQKARMRSLERFTAARDAVLVSTDVAARGLDIKNVDQVLHYHVPRAADTYIHRSGRTARGEGESGISVMLCSPDEVLPTRRLAGRVHEKRSGARGGDGHFIQTLSLDRKIASRLKPRVDLSKRLADTVLAKEKGHSDEAWLRGAAEELGVDYDAEDFDNSAPNGWGGRGGGRKRKEKEARGLSKAEMGAIRAELREHLSRRVNLGVSERYITGGRVDVAALLKERENGGGAGVFLGGDGLGLGL